MTSCSIFRNYVMTGRHHVPLLKGAPSKQILDEFQKDYPEQLLETRQWVQRTKMVKTSISFTSITYIYVVFDTIY